MKSISDQLLILKNPPLSWFGRKNIVTSLVLPRLTYLQQVLPIPVPKTYYVRLKREISKFVWDGKRARLACSVLCRPKDKGGIGLPDPELYGKAVSLSRVVDWLTGPIEKPWVFMEQCEFGSSISGLLVGMEKFPAQNKSLNPIVRATLSTWNWLQNTQYMIPLPSPLLQIRDIIAHASSDLRDCLPISIRNSTIEIISLFGDEGRTNLTVVTEFLLLGFQSSQLLRNLLFLLFLVVFLATICGNLLIIILVSTTKNLNTPMYFFISQLSISDILLSTNIVPNLLHILLNNGGTVSVIGCMTQLYLFDCTEGLECFLLAVMSYDRYVAICNPLRYSSVMTNRFCVTSIIISWLMGNVVLFIVTITSSKLNFCGSNIIDHLFCDFVPLLDLSCSDTFSVHLEIFVLAVPSVMVPSSIIVVSYIYIVISVLRIPSSTGRQKAFSACSSHLIVVSIFYWTIFSVYVFPKREETWVSSKILSLLYTVFSPFINPIIYSLRNKDIKKAI
ncbi:olfactory receptor 1468-like [Bufo bufo]|uniref:olfactory receptor 1468-like n=1 Tax=Bufo bufo TaxID=8384 RepID=UPI001ABED398|nr:olfactory receptor 1468-like [Bufo bufo]